MEAWDAFFHTDWFSGQSDPEDEKELNRKTSGPVPSRGGLELRVA
jgi:hypothetical protein